MRKLLNEELNRISPQEYKQIEKNPVILVLDNVRSLNNIGSIFRTADAFRVEAILLCGITGTPPDREIQKTALGATESVDWYYYGTTLAAIEDLKSRGYIIVSLEQTIGATPLHHFRPDKGRSYAFVFGHEIKGVQQQVISTSDLCLEIPQFGTKHSFNITVSAGIVLWDFTLKQGKLL